MAKAIKSFNVEKEVYDNLVRTFKKHGASTSLSFFVEQCLVKLLKNLSEAEEALKDKEHYPEIMKFVIERSVTHLIVTTEGLRLTPDGVNTLHLTSEPDSTIRNGFTIQGGTDDGKPDDYWPFEEQEKELEALYWIEEYEAMKLNLPRSYTRLLRTGQYELSRDRKFLIERATGKRFIQLGDTHVVEVAPDAKLIGPAEKM